MMGDIVCGVIVGVVVFSPVVAEVVWTIRERRFIDKLRKENGNDIP